MNELKNKERAFTLIELVIVMIIIGILVLLATPRFLNYVKKAKYTQIVNDIRVTETVSNAYMASNNNYPVGTSNKPMTKIKDKVDERTVYLKDGLVVYSEEDNYKPIVGKISKTYGVDLGEFFLLSKKEFVKPETGSRLKGDFYINKDGDVLYIDSVSLGGEPEKPEDKEGKSKYYDMFRYGTSNPGMIIGKNASDVRWREEFYYEGNQYFPEIPKYRKIKRNGIDEYIEITEIKDRAFAEENFRGKFKAPYIKKVNELAFLKSNFEGEFEMPLVEFIGFEAFVNSTFIGEFKAPNVEVIEGQAFRFSNFTGAFRCNHVTTIGLNAFLQSEFNEKLIAPKLKMIGQFAFTNSKFKYNFDLPSLERIGKEVFTNSEFNGYFSTPNIEVVTSKAFGINNNFTEFIYNPKDKYGRTLKDCIMLRGGWDNSN